MLLLLQTSVCTAKMMGNMGVNTKFMCSKWFSGYEPLQCNCSLCHPEAAVRISAIKDLPNINLPSFSKDEITDIIADSACPWTRKIYLRNFEVSLIFFEEVRHFFTKYFLKFLKLFIFWQYSTQFAWSQCFRILPKYSSINSTIMVHDDVIKWKHFPRCWPMCGENEFMRWYLKIQIIYKD